MNNTPPPQTAKELTILEPLPGFIDTALVVQQYDAFGLHESDLGIKLTTFLGGSSL